MQYCSLQHQTLLLSQSHPQLGIVFALAPSLHSFWSYSPLISSSILGTYRPRGFLFQYPIILPFHTVHGVRKARILQWFAAPYLGQGVSPHSAPPDLERGVAPLGLPAPMQLPLLGCGVAPLGPECTLSTEEYMVSRLTCTVYRTAMRQITTRVRLC